ncbi:MAG: cysteine desulfurase family protein [Microbacteriaceae bacterium]
MSVYLDHAATAPMPAAVRDAYARALAVVGNPASIHGHGRAARRLLEEARERVAASLGADAAELVLTGGGTEAVNTAVKGLYWARSAAPGRRRIVVPRGEHHATIDAVEWLAAREGADLSWIDLDERGRIDLDAFAAAMGPDVALATALWASNEVGTVQDVEALAGIAREHGVPLHLDAIAAYGALPIDVHALGVAALSVSAHKIGGPAGVGALYLARSASIEALLHGGEQQRSRSGSQDVAGAVAFGVAVELTMATLPERAARLRALRDRLIAGIRAAVPQAELRGDPEARLPGNVHVTVPGCEGDSLLFLLDAAGFSVSTGSACRAGVPEPSHVLLAMGLLDEEARGALRITLGEESTAAEIDALLAVLPEAVGRARAAGLAAREPRLGGGSRSVSA